MKGIMMRPDNNMDELEEGREQKTAPENCMDLPNPETKRRRRKTKPEKQTPNAPTPKGISTHGQDTPVVPL